MSSQGTKIPQFVQPGQKQKQRPSLPLHLTQIRHVAVWGCGCRVCSGDRAHRASPAHCCPAPPAPTKHRGVNIS